MDGLGAPAMMVSTLVLIYVAMRVGFDVVGAPGQGAVLGAFLLFDA